MPPATAASKASATPCLLGAPREPQSVLGDQRLVGGDDVLVAAKRGLDDIERDPVGAADQLDDGVDFRIGGHRGGVLVPAHRRQIDAAVAPPVASRGGGDDDAAAGAQADRFGLPFEQLDGRGADRAEPGNGDLQGWLHRFGSVLTAGIGSRSVPRQSGRRPAWPRSGSFFPECRPRRAPSRRFARDRARRDSRRAGRRRAPAARCRR